MKTYKQFKEAHKESSAIEKEEERSGIDVDHDKEKGESEAHKNKIKKINKEMVEFFNKRKEGAKKIALEAKSKGGPAMLTYWHFMAKDTPYREVLKAIDNDKNKEFFTSKCNMLASKLDFGKMTQEQLQKLLGELEVWSEANCQLFGKK